jgi:hypothetical protein
MSWRTPAFSQMCLSSGLIHDFTERGSGCAQASPAACLTCQCDLAQITASLEKFAETVALIFLMFYACVVFTQFQEGPSKCIVGIMAGGDATNVLSSRPTIRPGTVTDSMGPITHVKHRFHAIRQHSMLCDLRKGLEFVVVCDQRYLCTKAIETSRRQYDTCST